MYRKQGSRPYQKEKKCRKAKLLYEEALQLAVNRREVKGKGEKETYTHSNAEFQRIARRDKKAFLSEQCKEIEENNRMGKTSDHFKETAFSCAHLFLFPLPFASLLFTAICKASSDNHFAFCISLSWGWMVLITASCTMSQTSVHSSSSTLSFRSNPLNLFVTSTV